MLNSWGEKNDKLKANETIDVVTKDSPQVKEPNLGNFDGYAGAPVPKKAQMCARGSKTTGQWFPFLPMYHSGK